MGTAKQIFEKSKELRNWWLSVMRDERFAQVLVFTRSEIMDASPTEEQTRGARLYESMLLGLGTTEDPGRDVLGSISPGLSHVDVSRPLTTDKAPPAEHDPKKIQRRD